MPSQDSTSWIFDVARKWKRYNGSSYQVSFSNLTSFCHTIAFNLPNNSVSSSFSSPGAYEPLERGKKIKRVGEYCENVLFKKMKNVGMVLIYWYLRVPYDRYEVVPTACSQSAIVPAIVVSTSTCPRCLTCNYLCMLGLELPLSSFTKGEQPNSYIT